MDHSDVAQLREAVDRFARINSMTATQTLVLLHDLQVVPASIFAPDLSPLQSVVKYLKEHERLKTAQIAKLLNRPASSISLAYKQAHSVQPKRLLYPVSEHTIPVHVFAQGLSILESASTYLRDEKCLSFREIGDVLNRDERTVWTVCDRARKKYAASQGARTSSVAAKRVAPAPRPAGRPTARNPAAGSAARTPAARTPARSTIQKPAAQPAARKPAAQATARKPAPQPAARTPAARRRKVSK